MNQKQREYLVEQVKENFKKQETKIREELIEEPSLNNYLVAAFLDNSIQMQDPAVLKAKIRERVIAYGTNDTLIIKADIWGRRDSMPSYKWVSVPAQELFIIPDNYKEALKRYKDIRKSVDERIDGLRATRDTIIMKLNLGSNEVLDHLITQVDNLVDLNILNSQFLITDGNNK